MLLNFTHVVKTSKTVLFNNHLGMVIIIAVSIIIAASANSAVAQINNTSNSSSTFNNTESNNVTRPSVDIESAMQQLISSSKKVNIAESVDIIEKSLGANSTVNSIELLISDDGFLVYSATAIDPQGTVHQLIVDAGNGVILLDRPVG